MAIASEVRARATSGPSAGPKAKRSGELYGGLAVGERLAERVGRRLRRQRHDVDLPAELAVEYGRIDVRGMAAAGNGQDDDRPGARGRAEVADELHHVEPVEGTGRGLQRVLHVTSLGFSAAMRVPLILAAAADATTDAGRLWRHAVTFGGNLADPLAGLIVQMAQ
ncbi:hypothetical protein [Tessaracoccus flavescens]|nr:hypothetical protein [Tessaracoccus flavescens]